MEETLFCCCDFTARGMKMEKLNSGSLMKY